MCSQSIPPLGRHQGVKGPRLYSGGYAPVAELVDAQGWGPCDLYGSWEFESPWAHERACVWRLLSCRRGSRLGAAQSQRRDDASRVKDGTSATDAHSAGSIVMLSSPPWRARASTASSNSPMRTMPLKDG